MQYLEIAKIINSHGLLGEVKVLCNYYGKNFNNWKPEQLVYLKENNDYYPLTIVKVRTHKKFLLITFKNYYTIDSILFMKNKSLVIINSDENQNDKFLFENLINYQAVNNHDNKILGKIINLIDNNHTGLWEIVDEENKTFYVPNNHFFITKIDNKKKIAYFNVISGMFNYD